MHARHLWYSCDGWCLSMPWGLRARRFCISTYPGVQERVAEELGAAGLLSTPSRPAPRPVEFSDIFDLPILDAVQTLKHKKTPGPLTP